MSKNLFYFLPRRTLVLLLIFISLIILANLYIYYYRKTVGNMVKDYASKITVCENIRNEDDCFEKEFCEGIYDVIDSNLVFKSCQRQSEELVLQQGANKILCEKTQGQWYRNKLGSFCLCQSAGLDKIFDVQKGCIQK